MKVILWMAISLNGVIARENNEEDFISHDSWLAWLDDIRKVGCLLLGRKTHQIVKTWGEQYFSDLKGVKITVISSNPSYQVLRDFRLALSPQKALEQLKKDGFESVVLTGGSILNSSFAKLNLIDEIMFNIEPVIVGKGILVFNPDVFDLKLEFIKMKKTTSGTIQLHYKVLK